MLLATGRELEHHIGGVAFLLLFCLTGAFGWLCTLANYYMTMPEAWKDGIAQMQTRRVVGGSWCQLVGALVDSTPPSSYHHRRQQHHRLRPCALAA